MSKTEMSAADVAKADKAAKAAARKEYLAKLMGEVSPKAVTEAVAATLKKHQDGSDTVERTALESLADDAEAFASDETAARGITGEEFDDLYGKPLTEALKAKGLRDVKGAKSRVRTILLTLLNAPPVVLGTEGKMLGKVIPWEHAPQKREGYRAYYERVTVVLPSLKTRDGRAIIPANADGTRSGQGSGGGAKGGADDAQGSGGNTGKPPAVAAKEARENAATVLMGDAKAAAAFLAWLESPEGKALTAKLRKA